MRLIAALLLVIVTSPSVMARSRISGYCEQGGQVSVTAGVQSSTKIQQSYPNCTITVYYTGGATGTVSTSGTAVTLVSGPAFGPWSGLPIQINGSPYTVLSVTDTSHLTLTSSAGTQTGVTFIAAQPTPAPIYSDNNNTVLGNPFIASVTGYWGFYADNGTYDVKMNGGGIPQPFTWGAISAFDPFSAQTFPALTVNGSTVLNGTVGINGLTTFAVNNSSEAILIQQSGTGLGLSSNAQIGTTVNSSGSAVSGVQTGTGNAVSGLSAGTGDAVFGQNNSTGNAGHFVGPVAITGPTQITGTLQVTGINTVTVNNSSEGIIIQQSGAGLALSANAQISSGVNSSAGSALSGVQLGSGNAVSGLTTGTGDAVYGQATGSGNAAHFAGGPVKIDTGTIAPNAAAGFSGTKTAGGCTITFSGGLVTAVTGC